MAWQALVDGYAPKSANDPAVVLQRMLATPKRCKDAEDLKEKLTARSLKVAEYEHQLKVNDEAQQTSVVTEIMPLDIKREFLTGQRKFDEIMETLVSIINEMMADDGPVPMDLGNVGAHDARTTQSDQDTNNDMSYDDVRAIAWTGYKAGKVADKKGPSGAGTWHRGKGADEWTSGERDGAGKKGGEKGSKGSKPDWSGDKDKGVTGSKGTGKGTNEIRYCYDCAEQGHIGVNCPCRWTNSIDEEEDQVSSWESELEGEKPEELASLEAPDDGGERCWPKRNRITRWGKQLDQRLTFSLTCRR